MKVSDQLKIKFSKLGEQLSKLDEVKNALPTQELRDHFSNLVTNEIKNEIAVACVKLRLEVVGELNAIVSETESILNEQAIQARINIESLEAEVNAENAEAKEIEI